MPIPMRETREESREPNDSLVVDTDATPTRTSRFANSCLRVRACMCVCVFVLDDATVTGRDLLLLLLALLLLVLPACCRAAAAEFWLIKLATRTRAPS